MKKLSFITISLLISINLSARENPFEMSSAYQEESARLSELKESNLLESVQEAQYIKQVQENQAGNNQPKIQEAVNKIVPVIQPKPEDKTYSKKEVDNLISKTKSQAEDKTKQIVKKEIAKVKNSEPTQVVYVKPRPDLEEEMISKQLLSFVKVEYNDNKIIVNTDYKILKKFNIDAENKIVIDYKSNQSFLTRKDDLESKTFKKVAVGNHQREGFFRVVLELDSSPSNFDVNYKDNLVTVSRKN